MTRAALLLLALSLPGCGFARAWKETAEALKDDAVSRREATVVIREEIVPPLKHAIEVIDATAHRFDDVARWLLYLIVPGAAGGLFSFGKTAWRWLKKRAKP